MNPIKYKIAKIRISSNENIMQDFALAKCVINYNSSPAIVSTIEGIPTIQLDASRSQAAGVVHTKFEAIEPTITALSAVNIMVIKIILVNIMSSSIKMNI